MADRELFIPSGARLDDRSEFLAEYDALQLAIKQDKQLAADLMGALNYLEAMRRDAVRRWRSAEDKLRDLVGLGL